MNQLMRLRTPITDALGSARPVTGGEGSASDEPQPTAAKAQRTPTEAM